MAYENRGINSDYYANAGEFGYKCPVELNISVL